MFEEGWLHKFGDYGLGVLAEAFALPALGVGGLEKELGDGVLGIFAGAVVDPEVDSAIFFLLH